MTPTLEMIALAQRIADGTGYMSITLEWRNCYTCALAAIIETTERAAEFEAQICGYRQGLKECAIRNGEHLK